MGILCSMVGATYGPPPATYAISASTTTVNEGGSVTFTITTTNVPNGTTLYCSAANTGTIDNVGNDMSNLIATLTINNNTASFTSVITADNTTEGNETFFMTLRDTGIFGNILAQTPVITIIDTSQTPVSDAPTIPTLTWSGNGWTTATFNNSTHYRTSAMVGLRADGWHYLFARGDSGSGRLTHNQANLFLTVGFVPTAANSASMFSTTSTRGGNIIGVFSTSTSVRAVVGAVANWSTTPTQTSAPVGALATALTRSGGSTTDVAVAITARSGSTDTRAIVFYNNGGTLNHGKYVATVGASTFTNASSSGLGTGATGIGDFMGAAGFTTNDGTGRWMVGGASGSNYKVSGGVTTDMSVATSGTTNWNQNSALTATTLNGGGLAMAWDDFTNSKFVAVAMVLDGSTIKARAIKWSDGTMGTENSSVATGAFQAKISKVNSINSGFGMVMITYLKSATGNQIFGRLVSVDSSTLALTVGSEFSLGFAGDNLPIATTPSYGIDAAKDGTNWGFTAIWSNGANGDGGGWLSTATG